jgi:hypothetical protein
VFVLLDAYLYMIGTSHAPLMRMVFSSMLTEKQMQVNSRNGDLPLGRSYCKSTSV